ncbi:hypothetical protein [Burkholderia arboris]|uniref:hypothetical protein n=1 Tax=Burkholderia arboris TaxID=488730 RepID=UPI00158BD501|nr:hypothetical protein [Burkholderia arboris]
MTKEQLETIVGLFSGLQLGIIHLANTLADKAEVTRESVAQSFVATANSVPEGIKNRELIAFVLKSISSGIEQSESAEATAAEVRKILH